MNTQNQLSMLINTIDKIAVLLPDLRPGGAECLHLHLAGYWAGQGLKVDFVLRRAQGELLAQLPPGASVVALHARRVRHVLRPLVRYLKREQPDVLLAAMWPLTVIAPLAAKLAGFRGRVLVSEHSPLSVPFDAMISALNQTSCATSASYCLRFSSHAARAGTDAHPESK